MACIAGLMVDRGSVMSREEATAIPLFQWDIWFYDLSDLCPYRLRRGYGHVKQRNALRIEMAANDPRPRCSLRSPDGRGLAWVRSGGSALAYGTCSGTSCGVVDSLAKAEGR